MIDAVGAVRSMTQVYEAAELVFEPCAARTWKVCDPAARPEYDFEPDVPEPHAVNNDPSNEHWKLTDTESVYWNAADCDDAGFAGFDAGTITGTGGAEAPNPTAAHTPKPAASTPSRTATQTALLAMFARLAIAYGPAFT